MDSPPLRPRNGDRLPQLTLKSGPCVSALAGHPTSGSNPLQMVKLFFYLRSVSGALRTLGPGSLHPWHRPEQGLGMPDPPEFLTTWHF